MRRTARSASTRRPAHVGWGRSERMSEHLFGIVDEGEARLSYG